MRDSANFSIVIQQQPLVLKCLQKRQNPNNELWRRSEDFNMENNK